MESENTIKNIIETFLEKMGVSGVVEFAGNEYFRQFTIKTDDASLLIGEGGQNLNYLNIILKKIISKKLDSDQNAKPFILDVNSYQAKKIEYLINEAKTNAQRARNFGKEIVLKPMSAYERRIIHTALADYPDITTTSIGELENRQIVIKPL